MAPMVGALKEHNMTKTFALAIALTGVVAVFTPQSTASADPLYCVVVYDSQGRPINTTCVPAP